MLARDAALAVLLARAGVPGPAPEEKAAGQEESSLYDAANVASPLRKERVRLEGRMSPIRIRVPPRLEALAVLSP